MIRRFLLGVAVAALAASCGVPVDDAPRRIASEDAPFVRDVAQSAGSGPVGVIVFLARESRLFPAQRQVASTSVDDRLEALVAGETEAESSQGLRSAISRDAEVTHLGTRDGVAAVDLSPAFIGVAGEEQILAVAQIVFTATEAAGVSRVQFSLDGTTVAVPTEDGTLVDTPIGRDGFSGLAPP